MRILLLTLISAALIACTTQPASTPNSSAATVDPAPALVRGWQEIAPGGDTRCSDGTPYKFYVKPGDAENVLFYLDGGGACWSWETCNPNLKPTYTVNLVGRHPSNSDGAFNFKRADNPFAKHTVIFAPYCSGDVHLGARDAVYPAPDASKQELTVYHRGLENAAAALGWLQRNVKQPRSIVVAGSSAGAIPSPYYAMKVAQHFPNARVAQLGDGAGGYRRSSGSSNPHSAWGTVKALSVEPTFAGLTDDSFTYEEIYARAAQAQPNIQFAAYDTAEDDVQRRFLALGGQQAPELEPLLRANRADLKRMVPGIRSYIAGGELHTILRRPEFYTYRVGSVSALDWFADLATGDLSADVECSDCRSAEVITR